jgi:hypothetical protein
LFHSGPHSLLPAASTLAASTPVPSTKGKTGLFPLAIDLRARRHGNSSGLQLLSIDRTRRRTTTFTETTDHTRWAQGLFLSLSFSTLPDSYRLGMHCANKVSTAFATADKLALNCTTGIPGRLFFGARTCTNTKWDMTGVAQLQYDEFEKYSSSTSALLYMQEYVPVEISLFLISTSVVRTYVAHVKSPPAEDQVPSRSSLSQSFYQYVRAAIHLVLRAANLNTHTYFLLLSLFATLQTRHRAVLSRLFACARFQELRQTVK